MTAPLAADILFSAMLPEASTTNMTSAPAFLARRLLRISLFSTYTGFSTSPFSACLRLRAPWYGAAVLRVASTARRRTLPLGSIGLTYRPLSSLKINVLAFPVRP